MAAKKTKTKLSKPSVTLARDGYKFVLSFSGIDSDADYIHIEKRTYEAKDKKERQADYLSTKIGAKQNQSWTYNMNGYHIDSKNKKKTDKQYYYPFVADGTAENPKQSDLSQTIDRVEFTVWVTGKIKSGKTTKNIKSKTVVKSYEFGEAVKPSVAIVYDQNGTSFTYGVDMLDDYGIDSTRKKIATRSWVWLTEQVKGGSESAVTGHSGKWHNDDVTRNIRSQITTTISPDTPVKYTIHAYSAGPGGKSDEVKSHHIFAKPKPPMAPVITRSNVLPGSKVDNSYGIYDVRWNIDTDGGWRPVDNVRIEYKDQKEYKGASDIYGTAITGWQTAKDNIHSSIQQIQTDVLGAVAEDCVRYFRLFVEHDGIQTPGYVTGVVDYGKPTNVSNVKAEQYTITDKVGNTVVNKNVLRFTWSTPPTTLFGTSPNTVMYNGTTLGEGGRARILIFKNSVATVPIKTIYYDSEEWGKRGEEGGEWIYEIPESDLDQSIDYCFQVRVGHDNLNPGAMSDNLWVNDVIVPAKCKNVKATRLANNTSVEVTWDNPAKDDTIRNGIQVGWSTIPHAWESNSPPSTADFDNGIMSKAYITGLTAGEFYYFWVRRYEDSDAGTRNYGLWSDTSEGVLLADKPGTPTLTLSRTWIKEGGSLSAQWIYYASGNLPQKNAQIAISKDKSKWDIIANVNGEEDRCEIKLDTKLNGSLKYSAGDYYLKVIVKNAMGIAESEPIKFKIATKPTCKLTSASISNYTKYTIDSDTGALVGTTVKNLTKLPIDVNVSGGGNLNLYVYCIDDREWEHPDNVKNLYQGDCVWTSSVEAGDYSIENISLADNGRYRLQLDCVDPDTSLAAEPKYIDFEVHWDHQAVAPENSSVTVNEDRIVTLVPIKPEGALDTDVCDIYRTTVDGRYLCRKNVPWGTIVTDKLPTFGKGVELAYCFCTRTIEGDEAWVDLVYDLDGSGMIINFGVEEVVLPWNVTNGDNRTKTGEIRTHLGGSKTYYGQPAIDRSHSLSTVLVKMDNEDVIEKLYELSRYSELGYIRTSNGMGYPATINVSINRDYNNQIVSVSIDAKEVDSIDEFLGDIPTAD